MIFLDLPPDQVGGVAGTAAVAYGVMNYDREFQKNYLNSLAQEDPEVFLQLVAAAGYAAVQKAAKQKVFSK